MKRVSPRRRTGRLTVGGFVLLMIAGLATIADADDVRPVQLEITEQAPNAFLVQWRVPSIVPPTMMPAPILPEHCRPDGPLEVEDLSAAWVNRQTFACAQSLAGFEIGMDYPALNVVLSTLIRVELLSGEDYSHMLVPGEPAWRVPDADAGGFPRLARELRSSVIAGAEHALRPAHIALLLAALVLGAGSGIRVANSFGAGQLAGVAVAAVTGFGVAAGLAEIGVAVAAGVLASQALMPAGDRRQLLAVGGTAGIVHGLGIAAILPPPANFGGSELLRQVVATLGMDALLVATLLAVFAFGRVLTGAPASEPGQQGSPAPAAAVYAVAIGAFAIAMLPPGQTPATADTGLRLSSLPVPAAGAVLGGTGRVAAPFPEAPVQAFVAIDAFEVRRETLVRVGALAEGFGVSIDGVIDVEAQESFKQQVAAFVDTRTELLVDGAVQVPTSRRVDFLEIDAQGALPRSAPVEEAVVDALVGVTDVWLLPATPEAVALGWTDFATTAEIPVTFTDPEASGVLLMDENNPAVRWDNELVEDPIPVINATAVEPATLWLPLISLVALGAAAWCFGLALRRRGGALLAMARVMLAVAILAAPLTNFAVALPDSFGAAPDADGARRILAGVLPNIYKAFEFRSEEAAFDRLSLSVTGDTLTEVYLEHQRALEMEERGGARARVEAFEVTDVTDVEAGGDGAFTAEATWTIGGTVVHFGHRHFRQNRYDASVTVVPVDGSWKIRSIDILDETRLR